MTNTENLIAHGHADPQWRLDGAPVVESFGHGARIVTTYNLVDRAGERAQIQVRPFASSVRVVFANSVSPYHASAAAARFAACAFDYVGDVQSNDERDRSTMSVDTASLGGGIVTLHHGDGFTFAVVHFGLAEALL